MILIYLFALLTQPADKFICDLWTRALTQEAFIQACPSVPVNDLRVDVYTLDMMFICSRPATLLPNIQTECSLTGPLDGYILRIVKPAHQEIICMVESQYEQAPREEEIQTQCPGAKEYIIKPSGKREITTAPLCPMQTIPSGAGLYEQPASASDLATSEVLPMLAGKLIWFGYIKPSCEGLSGVDANHLPTPCGLAAARDAVLAWQNQFDEVIYTAANTYNVPARLLKRIMLVESSMWAFYGFGEDGEIGMMQVTDNGLDTLLRFDPQLDPLYSSRDNDAQAWSRANARQYFTSESLSKIHEHMPYYARLLAAFHCRAININPALTGADAWRQTVIDYNGTPDYLITIEN